MTYAEKLKDPRWQRKRLEIMQRDEFRCRDCMNSKETLTVHHCHYARGGPWDTPAELLLTLCQPCHELRQELEDDCRLALAKIFARLDVPPLREFVIGAVGVACNEETDPEVSDSLENEHNAEIRWWLYALDHPEFRSAYCAITGSTPKTWEGGF